VRPRPAAPGTVLHPDPDQPDPGEARAEDARASAREWGWAEGDYLTAIGIPRSCSAVHRYEDDGRIVRRIRWEQWARCWERKKRCGECEYTRGPDV